jgi:hypothetical protein
VISRPSDPLSKLEQMETNYSQLFQNLTPEKGDESLRNFKVNEDASWRSLVNALTDARAGEIHRLKRLMMSLIKLIKLGRISFRVIASTKLRSTKL